MKQDTIHTAVLSVADSGGVLTSTARFVVVDGAGSENSCCMARAWQMGVSRQKSVRRRTLTWCQVDWCTGGTTGLRTVQSWDEENKVSGHFMLSESLVSVPDGEGIQIIFNILSPTR